MKLSEAIRLGSMIRPQGFGGIYTAWSKNKSCAIGAALEAMGQREWLGYHLHWPYIHDESKCPQCGELRTMDVIIGLHLNDAHRWTRGRIADWVEEQEWAMEAKAETALQETTA